MAIFPTHSPNCKLHEGRMHISAMACTSSAHTKSPSIELTVKKISRPLPKGLIVFINLSNKITSTFFTYKITNKTLNRNSNYPEHT